MDNTTTDRSNVTREDQTTEKPLRQGIVYVESDKSYSNIVFTVKTGYVATIQAIGVASNTLSVVIIIKQGLIKTGIWVYIASLATVHNLKSLSL